MGSDFLVGRPMIHGKICEDQVNEVLFLMCLKMRLLAFLEPDFLLRGLMIRSETVKTK